MPRELLEIDGVFKETAYARSCLMGLLRTDPETLHEIFPALNYPEVALHIEILSLLEEVKLKVTFYNEHTRGIIERTIKQTTSNILQN
jgi:hypothetical protein